MFEVGIKINTVSLIEDETLAIKQQFGSTFHDKYEFFSVVTVGIRIRNLFVECQEKWIHLFVFFAD